jgi:hypothetical protein
MKGSNWIVRKHYDIRKTTKKTDYFLERKAILGADANSLCLSHNNIRKIFLVLLNIVKS